jgi:preprotein translocase subunit SecD
MKSIRNIFFIIITFISVASFSQNSETVILKAESKNVTGQQLGEASEIIVNRLKLFGLQATASPLPNKKQIKIEMPDNTRLSDIKDLLTEQGSLGFYETIVIDSKSKLACSSAPDRRIEDSVKTVLNRTLKSTSYILSWSKPFNKTEACLYALKTSDTGLSQKNLESAKSTGDNNSHSFTIDIKFKSESAGIWALMTEKSIGKPIAIVIDNRVFYDPVVRDAIQGGLCEITGNISKKEADYFVALISNEPLPIRLSIVK